MTVTRRILLNTLGFVCSAFALCAEPLTRKIDIDFFRDVPSRNLKGLATRSDGRLVGGPTLSEFASPPPADLLWCLEPTSDPRKLLIGSGPEGRILEVTLNETNKGYSVRDVIKLPENHVFALLRLSDGSILAGTSPKGALYLVRDGKTVSRVLLPVDSIFDLLAVSEDAALVATGNPGRIYRVDLRKFATVGEVADKITDTNILADRGITLFGEVRDRNVRRIASMTDGSIVAGSAPKGNVYTFPAKGGAPQLLQENRDAEVTDLLPQPNGELYATLVFSSTTGESRMAPGPTRGNQPPAREREGSDASPPPVQVDRFSGRSSLVYFPQDGFPETLTTRNGAAFYRLSRFEDTLILAGGDTGELLGFDLKSRFSLTFAGSVSAQINDLAVLSPGRLLLLRNNAPGLALLDFKAAGPREAETRRIELGPTPAQLGALRFNRVRNLSPADVAVDARVNNGTDEVEGWSPWTPLTPDPDEGRRAPSLRGRTVKFRLRLPEAANHAQQQGTAEIDRAALFILPQNRRPQLQEFRFVSRGFGLIPSTEPSRSPGTTLNQLLQGPGREEEKRRDAFLASHIVPQPHAQVVWWTVTDPDGDAFTCTFSYRREGDTAWTDIVTATRDSFAQFDTGHLPEGVYFTRLVATETAPRPLADRLSHTFETDDLVVDHTPPEIVEASVRREGDKVVVTLRGRDKLSLIEGLEMVFSNGVSESTEQPQDGVRDGRDETYAIDVPLSRVSNATSVEVTVHDGAGNTASRRLTW